MLNNNINKHAHVKLLDFNVCWVMRQLRHPQGGKNTKNMFLVFGEAKQDIISMIFFLNLSKLNSVLAQKKTRLSTIDELIQGAGGFYVPLLSI